jgi:hypothetical protein
VRAQGSFDTLYPLLPIWRQHNAQSRRRIPQLLLAEHTLHREQLLGHVLERLLLVCRWATKHIVHDIVLVELLPLPVHGVIAAATIVSSFIICAARRIFLLEYPLRCGNGA